MASPDFAGFRRVQKNLEFVRDNIVVNNAEAQRRLTEALAVIVPFVELLDSPTSVMAPTVEVTADVRQTMPQQVGDEKGHVSKGPQVVSRRSNVSRVQKDVGEGSSGQGSVDVSQQAE